MKQVDTKKFCGEIKEIETDADVENLIGITDRFHNAYVIKSEKSGDAVYVLFGGIKNCMMEMWYEGAAFCDATGGSVAAYGPWFYEPTFEKSGGLYCLTLQETVYCRFMGRKVRYRIIPD